MALKVNEIFYSLQGEGLLTGTPTVFIRLQGCNLYPDRCCVWCDTSYAQEVNSGLEIASKDIVEKCINLIGDPTNFWVCITGGEPLLQEEDLFILVRDLKSRRFKVEIETNGTITKPRWWTRVNSWSVDLKCPSSGVSDLALIKDWIDIKAEDQIKFVVGSKEDLAFARRIIQDRSNKNPTVLVSPVARLLHKTNLDEDSVGWDQDWLQEVAEFCKDTKVNFSLQLHKLIWGNKRGV